MRWGACLILAGLAAPAAAQTGRTVVAPYIEAQQVLNVPLSGDGETVTYTALSAGIDAAASGRRIEGTVSYRFDYRIAWNDDFGDNQVHSGLARGRVVLVPDMLTLEAGGIATRSRVDIRGNAPGFTGGDRDNVTQVYGGYVGPSLVTRVGPLDVTGSYRLGYVKAEGDYGLPTLAAGQPQLGGYDDSISYSAYASVGMAPGTLLPVGWNVSGGYERETVDPLDQRFENKFVRGQVIVPVSPTLAVTGAVGYEALKTSQRAIRLDANGLPVVDDRGRLVEDRSVPRQIAYDFDGLLYDVGVIWRPSPRTSLVATVGRRYGGLSVNGAFEHRFTPSSAMQVTVYTAVDSFGRSLNRGIAGLPTQFSVPRIGFPARVDGCVFGEEGTGGCLNSPFQSLNASNYRGRGVNALYSAGRGPIRIGIGLSYDERRYLAPEAVVPGGFTLDGVTDRSVVAQGNVAVALDARSSVQNQAFLGWYRSGLPGAGEVWTGGVASTYLRTFSERFSGNAGVALYATDIEGLDTSVNGQLLLGARYQF